MPVLLAMALLIARPPARTRLQAGAATAGGRSDKLVAQEDPLAAASSFDVLAACLSAGMAVPAAAAATAPYAPPGLARALRRAAHLLALGADPAAAWSNPGPGVGEQAEGLMRLARRSASSGTALAQGVTELAAQSRHDARDAATAAAQRASVLIAGPLGLCYLPAFLCLGIVPVVAGLAGDVLRSGVL